MFIPHKPVYLAFLLLILASSLRTSTSKPSGYIWCPFSSATPSPPHPITCQFLMNLCSEFLLHHFPSIYSTLVWVMTSLSNANVSPLFPPLGVPLYVHQIKLSCPQARMMPALNYHISSVLSPLDPWLASSAGGIACSHGICPHSPCARGSKFPPLGISSQSPTFKIL